MISFCKLCLQSPYRVRALFASLTEPAACGRLRLPVTIPLASGRPPCALRLPWIGPLPRSLPAGQERGRAASPLPQDQNQVSPSFRTPCTGCAGTFRLCRTRRGSTRPPGPWIHTRPSRWAIPLLIFVLSLSPSLSPPRSQEQSRALPLRGQNRVPREKEKTQMTVIKFTAEVISLGLFLSGLFGLCLVFAG
jgi:hypothetical protein